MAQASGGSDIHNCTLCQEDDTTNTAIIWCIECETFLCADCNKTHGRIKATKDHNTTTVDSFNNLPLFITEIKNHCQEHNKRLEVYCSFHAVACCLDCITSTHSECKGFRKIEDVLSDFKSSSSIYHAESDLNGLNGNFEKVTTHLTKQLDTIDTQKEKAIREIESLKQSVTDHLDKIAKCIVDDVENKHSDIKSNIKHLLSQIEIKKSELDKTKSDFEKMKVFATELQMYEGIKVIEKLANEKKRYFEELERKGALNDSRLEIELSPSVHSMITDILSFGNVTVESTPSSLNIHLTTGEQVNIGGHIKKRIDEIQPKLLKTIQIEGKNPNVSGCQKLPDGQMVFVEQRQKCLLLYSKDGDFVKTVTTFPEPPYDVAFVKNNVVAVTPHSGKTVSFVDIDENKIINSCKVDCKCFGITKDNDIIRVNTHDAQTIINIDLDGKIRPSIQIKSDATNGASFNNKLYVSECMADKVSCYTINGELLWTHKLDTGCHPRGLSVDRYGNIFVACFKSHSVIIVSADGGNHSTILKDSDGLHNPLGLHIDGESSKMLVCNFIGDSAFLFQI